MSPEDLSEIYFGLFNKLLYYRSFPSAPILPFLNFYRWIDSLTLVHARNPPSEPSNVEFSLNLLSDELERFHEELEASCRHLQSLEDDESVHQYVLEQLQRAKKSLKLEFASFRLEIENRLRNDVREIYAICKLRWKLEDVRCLELGILNNLKNLEFSLTAAACRPFWLINVSRLRRIAGNKLFDFKARFAPFRMSNSTRVQKELKELSSVSQIGSEEIQQLRRDLIPSHTELLEQRKIVRSRAGERETELEDRMESLDELQGTIEVLRKEVSRLEAESSAAQVQIKERRERLRAGLMELLKLEKLIEQIESEIAEKTRGFESAVEEMKTRRTQIMNDGETTGAEKLLDELEDELRGLSEAHNETIMGLESQRGDLREESRCQAEALAHVVGDLETHYVEEMDELEKMKIGASASQVLRIEEQIRQKRTEMTDSLKAIKERQGRGPNFEAGRELKRDPYSEATKDEQNFKSTRKEPYFESTKGVPHFKSSGEEPISIGKPDFESTRKEPNFEPRNEPYCLPTSEPESDFVDKCGRQSSSELESDANYANKCGRTGRLRDEEGSYFTDECLCDENRIPACLETQSSGIDIHQSCSDSSTTSSDAERRRDNLQYVKESVGRAVAIGLASCTLHRPSDPINYLANFLIQYRHNEIRYAGAQRELDQVLELRRNLRHHEDDEKVNEEENDECHGSG